MRLPPALRPAWPLGKYLYTRATPLIALLNGHRSRRTGGWLPARYIESLDAAVAEPAGGTLTVVRSPEMIDRRPPEGLPAVLPILQPQTRAEIRRQAVAELPHARVLGPHRAMITAAGSYVHELNWYFGTTRWTEHPLFWDRHVEPPLHVPGRLGVLASRGDSNYYHFVTDVLPKLLTLQASGVVPPDRWYVPAATAFQREYLDLLGMPSSDVIDAAAHPHVTADVLVLPTIPDLVLSSPRWVVPALRERLLPHGASELNRRLYVTRGRQPRSRIVVQETELLRRLQPLGFELIDPSRMSVADQISTFAHAEFVVAPHGAALTNVAFASPGCTVLELFAPSYVQGCYWKLAETVPDVRYRYHVGRGRVSRHAMGLFNDIDLDVPAVERQIRELLDER